MGKSTGTVLNCIDGRTQTPVIRWLIQNIGLDNVDSITEPGMDRVLSHGQLFEIESLKRKVTISVTAHGSNVIAVIGHYDCTANSVSDLQHFQDIVASISVVKSWGFPVEVIGLWVDKFWHVNVVDVSTATGWPFEGSKEILASVNECFIELVSAL